MSRALPEKLAQASVNFLQKQTVLGKIKDKNGLTIAEKIGLATVRWSRNHGRERDERSSITTHYSDGSIR